MNDEPQKYYDENSQMPFGEVLKYYSMTFFCRNCEYHNGVNILKGIQASTITITCKKCGCLVRRDK